jgi:citrate/tricarballylate utilization protein
VACDEKPGPARRLCHLAVSCGFGLCVVSTASAAFTQEFLGRLPPYPYLSVPVVTGTLGGVAMVVGCTGLVGLKRRSDPRPGQRAARGDRGRFW